MLQSRTVLIMDGSAYGAIDLSCAIEAYGGHVAGPVASPADALKIIDDEDIAAAVIDCELSDAFAVVTRLTEAKVPLIIKTCAPLPQSMAFLNDHAGVLVKPADTRLVVDALLNEIGKAEMRQERE